MGENLDADLETLDRVALIAEIKRLRAGIRAHRDSSGHDLCWHHPELWGLLPEQIDPAVAVPAWPQFLRGCVTYREALDRELRPQVRRCRLARRPYPRPAQIGDRRDRAVAPPDHRPVRGQHAIDRVGTRDRLTRP